MTFLSMCIAGILVFSEQSKKENKSESHKKAIHKSDNQLNVGKTHYSDSL
jgi:hypothetical protein